ncbi:MAG: tetratricopeptide repeat protein, partial [bacterium]
RLYRKLSEAGSRWSIYNPRVREHIEEGLKLLEDTPQHPERIKLVIAKAFDHYWQRPAGQVDIQAAEAAALEGYRLAEAAGSLEDMSAALDALASTYIHTADYQKCLDVSLQRVPIVQRLGQPHEQVDLHHMLAWTHEQVGRFPEGLAHAGEGMTVAKRSGIVGYQTQMIWDATRISTKWGRWDPVRGWVDELADIERRYGRRDRRRRHILSAIGRIAALRGRFDEARSILEEIEMTPPPGNPALGWGGPFSKLLITLAIPDLDRSRTLVEEGLRVAEAPWTGLELGTLALEFSALSKEWDYAIRLGDDMVETTRAKGLRYHLAIGCRAMGAYHRAAGRLDQADALLAESQDLFRALDTPWELGRTLRELALLRRDQGRTEEATVLLNEALSLFQAMGAVPDIERTRSLI